MMSNEAAPDSELLRRIAEGETGALGEFYDAHAKKLFAFALRILKDPKEAEDTIQEVFLQVWEKAATYKSELGRPLAWVITLTRNRAVDRIRSSQRRARLVDDTPLDELEHSAQAERQPEPQGPGGDEVELIRSALALLPPDQRKAIELAFFSGFTQTEIATALDQPLGTVKARIRRGMQSLRGHLTPAFNTAGGIASSSAAGSLP